MAPSLITLGGKRYSRLSDRSDSPSETLLTPGQEKKFNPLLSSSYAKGNRRYVVGTFALLLSLGFNLVWLSGLIFGAHETCYPTHETHFVEQAKFSTVYKEDNKAWLDLQGVGGVVYTSDNREDGVVRMGGVAMFHQLHCIDSFRHAVQQLHDGKEIGYDSKTDMSAHQGHWPHCFDYLRQAILCYADDTIETSQLSYQGEWIISGYPGKRQCRNAKALYDATSCQEKGCPGTRWALSDGDYLKAKKQEFKETQEAKKKAGMPLDDEPDWQAVLDKANKKHSVGCSNGDACL